MSIKHRLTILERINRPRPYVVLTAPDGISPDDLNRLRSEALAKAGVLESENPLVVVLRTFSQSQQTRTIKLVSDGH